MIFFLGGGVPGKVTLPLMVPPSATVYRAGPVLTVVDGHDVVREGDGPREGQEHGEADGEDEHPSHDSPLLVGTVVPSGPKDSRRESSLSVGEWHT